MKIEIILVCQPIHMGFYTGFVAIIRWFIEDSPLHAVRQILLFYIMLGIIVRIFVSCPVPQLLSSLIMPVLQVYRNRHGPLVPDCVHGLKHSHAGRIALWRGCHIGHCLGQDDLGFRKSDPLHGLGRIHSHRQCLGISRFPHPPMRIS